MDGLHRSLLSKFLDGLNLHKRSRIALMTYGTTRLKHSVVVIAVILIAAVCFPEQEKGYFFFCPAKGPRPFATANTTVQRERLTVRKQMLCVWRGKQPEGSATTYAASYVTVKPKCNPYAGMSGSDFGLHEDRMSQPKEFWRITSGTSRAPPTVVIEAMAHSSREMMHRC